MYYSLKKIALSLFFVIVINCPANATIYFYYDAESGTVGTGVPRGPGIDICTVGCTSQGTDAKVQSAGGAPQGSKYFQWDFHSGWPSQYTEAVDHTKFSFSLTLGNTYYLAYFFNQTRIGGIDIYNITGQSADKHVEIDGTGIRWLVCIGHWGPFEGHVTASHFTTWLGNPTYHLNPELEVSDSLMPNQNGYSASNPLLLEYERWYAVVMAVKIASDHTGSVTLYVNGVKIAEYTNIQTSASGSPAIEYIEMNGTVKQGTYDAVSHYRKMDALILTNNWQDIVNGGYLSNVPSPPTLNP